MIHHAQNMNCVFCNDAKKAEEKLIKATPKGYATTICGQSQRCLIEGGHGREVDSEQFELTCHFPDYFGDNETTVS